MKSDGKNRDTRWLSAYLYHSDSSDIFLKRGVAPFIKKIKINDGYKKFFFIRYQERGQHIRLRIRTKNKSACGEMKRQLNDYFTDYFLEHPSRRSEEKRVITQNENDDWIANDSVHFYEYEPEYDRYGGTVGMKISEDHFHICSNAVLDYLSETEDTSYSKSLGISIQLSLSMCLSFKMTMKEMEQFFFNYCNFSIFTFHNVADKHAINHDYDSVKTKLLEKFETMFNAGKKQFLDLHDKIIYALRQRSKFEEFWFNDWVERNRRIGERLNKALMENRLETPTQFREREKLFYIYYSYLHMLFNRLGLYNQDEAYISFIIYNCLKNIKSKYD
ncbi:MAG TPA: thiopeptide-type bacteriocin biosynthesis protein [Ignavibacteria bacterium]|nr:thiopeptide-type bacteriocin biosynthesis protein [Ignavibacteria bacterium]